MFLKSANSLEENVFIVLKNNITRAAQSLLYHQVLILILVRAFRNITQKGCHESGAVGWTLDRPYDCRTGGDWGAI